VCVCQCVGVCVRQGCVHRCCSCASGACVVCVVAWLCKREKWIDRNREGEKEKEKRVFTSSCRSPYVTHAQTRTHTHTHTHTRTHTHTHAYTHTHTSYVWSCPPGMCVGEKERGLHSRTNTHTCIVQDIQLRVGAIEELIWGDNDS